MLRQAQISSQHGSRGQLCYVVIEKTPSSWKPLDAVLWPAALSILSFLSFPANIHPRIASQAGLAFDQALYLQYGEQKYLVLQLEQKLGISVGLIGVPRTLWELFFIDRYCRQRIDTPYGDESVSQDVPLCVDCFYYDYNGTSQVTMAEFESRVLTAVMNSSYQRAALWLNSALWELLSDWIPQSDADWISLGEEVVKSMFDIICTQLSDFHPDSGSEEASAVQIWPLTKPGLLEQAELRNIELDTLVDCYLNDLDPFLTELQQAISQCNSTAENLLDSLRRKCKADAAAELLVRCLCPMLLDDTLTLASPTERKRLKRALRLLDKFDSAVHTITHHSLDRDLLWSVIQLELGCSDQEFLLFRCSSAVGADSTVHPTGAPHSLSFGMSIFSGARFDRSASIFNLACKPDVFPEIYALKLSVQDALDPNSLFFVPPLPPLLQLSGLGELFHPRTKVYVGNSMSPDSFVSGLLRCPISRLPPFLQHSRRTEDVWLSTVQTAIRIREARIS